MDKITTHPTATAYGPQGNVTLGRIGGTIYVLTYSTNAGHQDIGSIAQKPIFERLRKAARRQLLAIEAGLK